MSEYYWEDKAWGRTRFVTSFNNQSVHELELIKNGYCSFHYHEFRNNVFIVRAGLVRVVWCYGWEIRSLDISPYDPMLAVDSRIPHQFQVLEPGNMIEVYYSRDGDPVLDSDIHRLTTGGVTKWNIVNEKPSVILTGGKMWDTGNIDDGRSVT